MRFKTKIIKFLYKNILKKYFFLQDPEKVHDNMLKMGIFLGKFSFFRTLTRWAFFYKDSCLEQSVAGIHFQNPVGLAAGFDKNADITDILPEVGFGFIEVGSITGEPCEGNPKPRLWRLPKSESLLVYYGLKNEGAVAIEKKLQEKQFRVPVGMSIAKTNCQETVDTERGVKDYLKAYQTLSNLGAYDTLNISCPNAFGGQAFTNKVSLDRLLSELMKCRNHKPLFLKISPDLSFAELDDILELVVHYKIDGIICSNLTKNRENDKIQEKQIPDRGGISGKVLEELSNNHISYIYKKTGGALPIIGVGGIFSAEDAYTKIRLGASLVQLITGMIFEGPQLIGEINSGLVQLLKQDGFKNIADAIGIDVKL